MDETKLHQFVGQMMNDLGGAVTIALVQMGDALGLYKTLHQKGPMTAKELAAAAGGLTSDTYVNGHPIMPLPIISATIRRHRNLRCPPNRRWCLRLTTAR
jgi:hypothetical protein